jgi:hypothetical protein
MNAKESYVATTPMTTTESKKRRQEDVEARSSKRMKIAAYVAGAAFAALGIHEVAERAVDVVGGKLREAKVSHMLSEPAEVVEGQVAAGAFKPGEVTKLTVNESGTTFSVAQDIARDEIDMSNMADIMTDQIGEHAEAGEQVFVPTQDVDPKILQPQVPQQPK